MATFVVTGSALHEAAAWASRATPAKPTAPVLAGLLLDAADELTITGYDFETRASAVLPVTTTQPGRVVLSARLLTAIAKTVNRNVDVTVTDNGDGAVDIRAGSAQWTAPALPVDDYPRLPDLDAPAGAVNAGDLRRALARILPVLSAEPQPAFLSSVRLESEGDRLTIVGTDRFRLAVATIGWQPTAPEQQLDSLVPGQLLDTAVRAAGGDSDLVSLHEGDLGFGVATDTRIVTGRQVAESYVRWRGIMPEPAGHHAVVDVASLNAAVEQALVAVGAERQILLAFTDGQVQVSAAGANGRARAAADTELVGDSITVKVNAGYLRDAVSLHGCDQVTIHFGASGLKPFLVLGDDDSYRHLVTPVRLTDEDRSAA